MPLVIPVKGEDYKLTVEVGEKVELYIHRGVGNKRYASMIQDIDNTHIWVSAPTIQGQEVNLPAGEKLTVRIARYNSAYFYQGEVIRRKLFRAGLPFIGISLPEILNRTQLRLFSRIPISLKITFDALVNSTDMEEYTNLEGSTLDFSAGGIKFQSPQALPAGSFVFMKFLRADLSEIGEITTKVLTSEPYRGNDFVIKNQFLGLSKKAITEMIRFVWAEEIELRRRGVI